MQRGRHGDCRGIPSFIGALNAFRSCGAKLVGVGLEEDGVNIDALEAALKANPNAKIIYLIPTFQNPAGTCMSLEKRKAALALAKKYGVLILEDNPYGELRFAGEEIPTIKSMDEDGIVVYSGSYSKVLSAGMRIGFICGPEPVVQKMVVAKQVEDVHTNIFFPDALPPLHRRVRHGRAHRGNPRALSAQERALCCQSLTAICPTA